MNLLALFLAYFVARVRDYDTDQDSLDAAMGFAVLCLPVVHSFHGMFHVVTHILTRLDP